MANSGPSPHIVPLQTIHHQQPGEEELRVEREKRRRRIEREQGEEDEFHNSWMAKIKETRNQEDLREWKKEMQRELGTGAESRRELIGLNQAALEERMEIIVHRESNLKRQIALIKLLNPECKLLPMIHDQCLY